MTDPSTWCLVPGEKHVAYLWARGAIFVDEEIEQGIGAALISSDLHEVRHGLYARAEGFEDRKLQALESALAEPSIAGVLTAFLDFPGDIVEKFAKAGKPLVMIERPEPVRGKGNAMLDHRQGARLAAKALVELGRTRLGYVGPCYETGWAGGVRHEAIVRELAGHGIELAGVDEITYDMNAGAAATERLLEKHPDLDAIVFASDIQAFGGLKKLREKKIEVPGTIAVIAFDDTPNARRVFPPLSSVKQPFQELGYVATKMLLEAIAGDKGALKNIVLPEELVLRGSALPDPREEKLIQES